MIFIYLNLIIFISALIAFLLAIKIMSTNLDNLATTKIKKILHHLSPNKYMGILIGTLITALIHSSSATTIILIGLLNSHLITLNQATWVILGANIGTTATGLLIAFNFGKLSWYLCILGIILFLFKGKGRYLGAVFISLGTIFITMNLMSLSLAPFQNNKLFIQLLTNLNNPILAIIIGTVFTAIIQSSTASLGVLQTIYQKGLISFTMAANVIYGQNIGTCITALIASFNGEENAKRLALIHVLVNVIGAIFFLLIDWLFPIVSLIKTLTPNYMLQIAYMHTIFNLVSTIILLPFDNLLIQLTYLIYPPKKEYSKKARVVI